jgi:hypothetical protein
MIKEWWKNKSQSKTISYDKRLINLQEELETKSNDKRIIVVKKQLETRSNEKRLTNQNRNIKNYI